MENKKDGLPILLYLGIVFIGTFIISFLNALLNNSNIVDLASIAMEGLVCLILIIKYRKMLIDGFKKLDAKRIIKIVIIGIIVVLINELISELFVKLNIAMENQDTVVEMFNSINKIVMFLFIVIIGPIVEEFVTRYSIGTLIKNDKVFIIVSGIIFGILHGVGIATILYILLGGAFAYFYVKSDKNIVVPIMLHVINNLVSFIMMLFL